MKRSVLNQLMAWKDSKNRKPLILQGPRQVGKTFSLKEFGRAHFETIHYVNFEKDQNLEELFSKNLDPRRIIDGLSFYLSRPIVPEKDFLFLDEIQNSPSALTSLKYFAEEVPQFAICAAGSLLGVTLTDASFPVGKINFLEMHPMSFEEFLSGIGDEQSEKALMDFRWNKNIPDLIHSHLWERLKQYFVVGGLPEVVQTFADHQDHPFEGMASVRKKQEDLITAYLADMAKHSGKQNSMELTRLWKNIPAQLAKNQDGSASRFVFKGVIPGKSHYARIRGSIDWLVAAGLVIQVPIVNSGQLPSSAYIKENILKMYLFDVGLLGALSELAPKVILDYDYGTYKGYFAENYIAQEFVRQNVRSLYAWSEGTAEIEFLREIDGQVVPVEVKSGFKTKTKSLHVFISKYRPPYGVIFSANKPLQDRSRKIYRYPLYLAHRFPVLESESIKN